MFQPLLVLLYVFGSFGGCDAVAVETEDRTPEGAVEDVGWGSGGCSEPSPTTAGGTNILGHNGVILPENPFPDFLIFVKTFLVSLGVS